MTSSLPVKKIINTETKIIESAPEYTLKYDERSEGLRDKTYSELVLEHGRVCIKCPCMNRIYPINSQSIKSHFESQKHKKWVQENQKDYIKMFGHCCSPQDIVNLQNKELRSLKCNINDLTNQKNELLAIIKNLEEKNKQLTDALSQYEGETDIFMECNL
jgi:hypothetical protein